MRDQKNLPQIGDSSMRAVRRWPSVHRSNSVECADQLIHEHGKRVAHLAFHLAICIGASEMTARAMAECAAHHDIGKLYISSYLLFFPGPLTEIEKLALKQHPVLGSELALHLFPSNNPAYRMFADACRHHHEQWNGKGYPDGLGGADIPLVARIVAIADAFDALTSERSYRGAISHDDAVRAIAEGAGSQFDPDIVEALESVVKSVPMADLWGQALLPSRWFYEIAQSHVQNAPQLFF